MQKIFVAGKLPKKTELILKQLDANFWNGTGQISETALIEGARTAEAIVCPLSAPVSQAVLENAPKLKIVANVGAGFDNIDVAKAKELGIAVTNTPDVSTESTAELTFGLIIDVMRRISEGDRLMREQPKKFEGWAPTFFLGHELYGKTIGIIGLGKIGQAVAKRAYAFGMSILYAGPHQKKEAEAWGARYVSESELIETSDVISIHAAYNEALFHLFDAAAFAKMKPSAFLINASRGKVVDEKALILALQNKQIAGAALDVFEFEPKFSAELKQFDNLVLTPHIGNATIETREKMGEIAVANVQAVLAGGKPLHSVY
ncbi:NAD(P)-dependent oxidoreductase [Listeria floridensis]|uniref:NAD(P)-dependent oxidoreductase n=1 Tax=Listeria floridensis TaxID=1494962 RepID=UPI00055B1943